MQATTIPLATLLTPRERFVAPLYQRPYVWERERNWEPFWETVRDVAEYHVRREFVRPRFLGAIVLEQMSVPVGQATMRQIIDGQQRLTTLQIVLAAARDVCKLRCDQRKWNSPFAPQFEQMISNLAPFQLPEEQFKVWPTNADREPFQRVMTSGGATELAIAGGSPPAWQEGVRNPKSFVLGQSSDPVVQRVLELYDGWSDEEWGAEERLLTSEQGRELRSQWKKLDEAPKNEHLMVGAYWYFWSSLAQWFDADDAATSAVAVSDGERQNKFNARVQAFLNAVQQSLVLVAINLDPGEDAQMIFETMNARGLPLAPADLVKNFLFHQATAQGEDLDALYQAHWRNFDDESWWRDEVRLGRLMRPRIDAFLWNYLTLSTRREVIISELFPSYRDWSPKSGLSAAQQIARFAEYSQIFRSFESSSQPSRVKLFLERLSILDVSTVYPLLLELFHRHRYTNTDLETILVDLESYLVRRLLVGLTTKNYNRLFFDLLQELEKKNDFSPASVRATLSAYSGETRLWPNDTQVEDALKHRSLYGTIKAERLTMILQALDRQMHTSKSDDYTIHSRQTIEHLMPRSWQTHWPLPVKSGQSVEDATQKRESLLHTLGNLTLVTGKLNSALSNGAWGAKLPEIKSYAAIHLNRNLPANWNEAAIQKRGARLAKLALEIWPAP